MKRRIVMAAGVVGIALVLMSGGARPEQTAIAQKWNAEDPWAPWNETASAAATTCSSMSSRSARARATDTA